MIHKIRNHKIKIEELNGIVKVFIHGTNDIIDLFDTIMCWKNKKGFHFGTYRAAKRILKHPEILLRIEGKTVRIGGHSLGGSIAECMAHICRERELCKIESLITYGSYPVSSYPEDLLNTKRFEGRKDIVPDLFSTRFIKTWTVLEYCESSHKWPFRFYYDHINYPIDEFFNE